MQTTTVGWCAGRPADHGLTGEAGVASKFLTAYPGTSAVRDFRGAATPSSVWWTSQTLAAVKSAVDTDGSSPEVAQGRYRGGLDVMDVVDVVDVVVSGDRMGQSLESLLGSIPAWVRRLYILGTHEPEVKISPAGHLDEFRTIRQQITAAGLGPDRVMLGPAYILYRARIGAPDDVAEYLDPLLNEELIDFVAWDGYPSNPDEKTPTNPEKYEDAEQFCELPRYWMQRSGLPYAWAELHHKRVADDTDGFGCAAWHQDIYRTARADGALFVTQFAYSGGDFLALDRKAEAFGWASVIKEARHLIDVVPGDIEVGDREYRRGWTDCVSALRRACVSALRRAINETLEDLDGPRFGS